MSETIVFGDATATALSILASLPDPGFGKVPNPRLGRFYVVRRVGGPKRNVVTDQATLTVESWAESTEEAHDMAQLARAALNAAQGSIVLGIPIYRVDEASGPADLPDPLSGQPRYSQTFSVALRAT